MKSPLLLLGVGGAGTLLARKIRNAYQGDIRLLAVDTDARSELDGTPFALLGGNRLSGHGSGGQTAQAKSAFLDNPSALDKEFEGVRVAVMVTGLGGGTGSGIAPEILKRLRELGIHSLVFATTPFAFEGEDRARAARLAAGPLEQNADVAVVMPLDALVAGGPDNMQEALTRAADTLASGVTLLWRVLEKPGFVRLDSERLRTILIEGGPAMFATASAAGPDRVATVMAAIKNSPLLARRGEDQLPVRRVACGILAGDDLLLSEVSAVSESLQRAYPGAIFDLGTVRDEDTFSGRVAVAVLVFHETPSAPAPAATSARTSLRRRERAKALAPAGRFENADSTMWNGEDLDIPSYLRRNLTIER